MFCRNCGKPSETPVCPECAAAQQAPVAQPEVAPTPVPVEAPAPAEDYVVMNLGNEQPAVENAPAKKKKSKKALWISLIAIVSVVGLVLGLFWNTIMGWFRYQTSDPAEWYQEVEVETAKAATGGIAQLYGMLIKGEGLPLADFNTADTTLSLQIDPTLLDAVSAFIPNLDELPVDLNKLQNLSVSTKFTATEDMLHLAASLGGQLDLHIYADMPNSKVYLQLPQAQQQALVIDTKALFGLDLSVGLKALLENLGSGSFDTVYDDYGDYDYDDYYDDYYGDYNENVDGYSYGYSAATAGTVTAAPEPTGTTLPETGASSVLGVLIKALESQTFKDAMPSEAEFQTMLDHFVEAAIAELSKTAQKDRRTVSVGGGSETQNVLTTTINESTVRQALKAVLTTAQNDATVKKILDAVSAYLAENGTQVDLNSMVSMAIPGLIAEMDQPIEGFGIITLETFLNDENEVVGRSVLISGMGEPVSLSYNVVNNEYFQVALPGMAINGTITEQDGETTVSFDLPVDGANVFKVKVICSDTKFALRVTPPAELLKQLVDVESIPSMLLNELSAEIGVESTGSSNAKLWVSALAGETRMITVSLSETLSKETPIPPSNSVSLTNLRDAANWMMSVDSSSLAQALTNLGVKQEYAENLISQLIYNLVYELS